MFPCLHDLLISWSAESQEYLVKQALCLTRLTRLTRQHEILSVLFIHSVCAGLCFIYLNIGRVVAV